MVVLIDVVFEKIFGFNTLGYKSPNPDRIVSFFKDEMMYALGNLFQNSITYSKKLVTVKGDISASGDLYLAGNDIYAGGGAGTKRWISW